MGTAEKPLMQLSRAQEYGESVLSQMREKPGDCRAFDSLVPEIVKNPLILFGGAGGGLELASEYLRKLMEIHRPYCKQNGFHQMPEF